MITPSLISTDDITDEQVAYLAGLAENLSTQEDFSIDNFADSTITSPDVQAVFQAESFPALDDEDESAGVYDITESVSLALSAMQQNLITAEFWPKLKAFFKRLKKKVNRIFCSVAKELDKDSSLDAKKIIKQVLLALIPALAASSGLLPIAIPIVVSLAAMLLKHGVAKVCPK